jgi:hypothetical protein
VDTLPRLAPVSGAYATLPVAEAFNWADAAAELGAGSWYMVAFRSIRLPDADEARLNAYDERAHLEAAASPGFVHYFKGPRADDGSCLSFCLWTSREEARAASAKPEHAAATALIDEMYRTYALEFLSVHRDAAGTMTFEPYRFGPPPAVHATDAAPASAPAPLALRPAPAS